jgi:hypothetical protein
VIKIQVVLHMDVKDSDARHISWWAESPDVDGWTAGALTLSELTQQVEEGLVFYLDDNEIEIHYVMPRQQQTGQGPVLREHRGQPEVPLSQGLNVSSLVSA